MSLRASKFWITEPINKVKDPVVVDNQPSLPPGFIYSEINSTKEFDDMADFLSKYYTENMDNKFKLKYTRKFLQWTLGDDSFAFGLRSEENNKLLACIAVSFGEIQVNKDKYRMANVNYMCIHPKLRRKNLAGLLMKETKRRIMESGVTHAIFPSNKIIPVNAINKSFVSCKSYSRPINISHLLDTEFTTIDSSAKVDIDELKRALRLPPGISYPSDRFRKMEEDDVEDCYEILNEYFEKYNVHPIFSIERFKQLFLSDVLNTYVVLDGEDMVVDFVSYYTLNYKITNSDKIVKGGFLFYYTSDEETPYKLVKNLMITAKKHNVDIFHLIDVLENEDVWEMLSFTENPNKPYYYLYNSNLRPIINRQVGYLPI